MSTDKNSRESGYNSDSQSNPNLQVPVAIPEAADSSEEFIDATPEIVEDNNAPVLVFPPTSDTTEEPGFVSVSNMASIDIPIPLFDGTKNCKTTWEDFRKTLDAIFSINASYSDLQKVTVCRTHLRKTAADFVDNLAEDETTAPLCATWATLKAELEKRFGIQPLNISKAATLGEVKQLNGEGVQEFRIRIETTKNAIDRELTAAVKKSDVYKALKERDIRAQFRAGIREDLKLYLNTNYKHDAPLDTVMAAALELEKIRDADRKNRGSKSVESISGEKMVLNDQQWALLQQMEEFSGSSVNSIKKVTKKKTGTVKKSNNPSSNSSGNQQGAKREPSGSTRSDGSWLCFKCWSYGKHYAYDCQSKQLAPPTNFVLPRAAHRYCTVKKIQIRKIVNLRIRLFKKSPMKMEKSRKARQEATLRPLIAWKRIWKI